MHAEVDPHHFGLILLQKAPKGNTFIRGVQSILRNEGLLNWDELAKGMLRWERLSLLYNSVRDFRYFLHSDFLDLFVTWRLNEELLAVVIKPAQPGCEGLGLYFPGGNVTNQNLPEVFDFLGLCN